MQQIIKRVRDTSVSDYERGRKDRRDGHLPVDGMSDKYYQGYAYEYEKEQQEDAKTS
jgi:hypothetical protein